MFGVDPSNLINSLASRHGIFQLGTLVLVALLAWLLARMLQHKLPDHLQPGLAKIGAGSAYRMVTPLVLLVLAWLGRFALAKLQPVPLLNIAIPLIAAFAVIRLAVYLLRHVMTPSALLKASERFIVLFIWGLFALYITGALTEIGTALEDVTFPIGNKKITLRLIIEAGLSAMVTIFVALGISGLIETRIMKAQALNVSSRVVISKLIRALALTLSVLIALPLVGFDLTMLSVFGGALGVGLGFGLQKIASNYISGFIILLDRSLRLGDLITIENRQGVIDAIKSRYTVIRSLDGTEAFIPNDILITSTVINHTYTNSVVSVKTLVTISYDSDLALVRALLLDIAAKHPRVLNHHDSSVLVKALGENGIEIELSVWINNADQGQNSLRSDLLIEVLQAFRKNNISIPHQQRDVRITDDLTNVKAEKSVVK
jgi:small-conductance mechanosensitive channel